MTATLPFDALLQDALRLPVEDRSRMASRLIESLDEDIAVSPAWQAEIRRRVQAVKEGSVRTIAHEEVMSEVRQSLATIRQQKQSA
jgi:putative addiction module component (TIGR02574 family)